MNEPVTHYHVVYFWDEGSNEYDSGPIDDYEQARAALLQLVDDNTGLVDANCSEDAYPVHATKISDTRYVTEHDLIMAIVECTKDCSLISITE